MKYTSTILVQLLFCTAAFCLNEGTPQTTPPAKNLPPGTLSQQYKNLKEDLDVINGFRMVKLFTMDRFWTVVEDSLRTQKTKYGETIAVIAKQKEEIGGLNASLSKIQEENQGLKAGVDNMLVFGKEFPKTGVISTASIIVIGLLVLSGILFAISRVSYYTTRELRKLNESMYQEFDNYKRNAVEKEIKLSRELQNYRNKFSEAKMA
jgi:LPXTG-motif cell wall-anchored protein